VRGISVLTFLFLNAAFLSSPSFAQDWNASDEYDAGAQVLENSLQWGISAGQVADYGIPLNRWRGLPEMSNSRWIREYAPQVVDEYANDAIKQGIINYGSEWILSYPAVNDYNYQMWQYFDVVQ
jgi:hypothetical protein